MSTSRAVSQTIPASRAADIISVIPASIQAKAQPAKRAAVTGIDLLQRFERDAEVSGLIGEKNNAKVILLVAASAKLEKPLNVNVAGSSSAGKNHLINCVARFIPDEDKKYLTGMSPKVLMHSEENEYKHKAVLITEYEGVSGADYAIRTMQSERGIDWEFVESSTAGIQKKKKRVNGPVAFVQATTRVTLHPENETRLLFLQMDESEAQTRAVNERQAMEAEGLIAPVSPDLFTSWHEFFRSLKAAPVRIPFARQLVELFPAERVRSRRDFPKLLGLIEVSAYLHQHRRNRHDGNIVASAYDYAVARELFEHCYHTGPDKAIGELLEAAEVIANGFTVADLIGRLKWGKTKTYQVLERAEELGCVAETERRGCYRLIRKQIDPPLNLPAKIKLTADNFRISAKVYPLSNNVNEGHKETGNDFGIVEIGLGGHFGGKTENGAIPKDLAYLPEIEPQIMPVSGEYEWLKRQGRVQ